MYWMTRASALSSKMPSNERIAAGKNCRNRLSQALSPARSLDGPGSSFRPLSNRQRPDLQRQARAFAGDLSELLNGTATDGIRLRSYLDPRGRAVLGYNVSMGNSLGDPIPLTVSRSSADLHLSVLQTLDLDDSGMFLTTNRSTYTLQEGEAETSILTYDFVREPPNDFPEAHIHLHGESSVLRKMLNLNGRKKDKPADLHIPVGGRRFRPCLEDLIEFCILERLATPREGWKGALEKSKNQYYDRQLRAAIRRSPELAVDVLKQDGWDVRPP